MKGKSVLKGVKWYHLNAEIIVGRGKLGLETKTCQRYYEGVVREIESNKELYEDVYRLFQGRTYKSVFNDLKERTGESDRTVKRILSLQAKQCANVIEKYEDENYKEFMKNVSRQFI